ncbi:hypothetical protein JCM3766R1_004879 [Sporobolomyces carnicolor]
MLRTLLLRSGARPPQTAAFGTTSLAFAKPPKRPINKLLFPRPSSKRASRQQSTPAGASGQGATDSYQLTAQLVRLTSHSRFAEALALLHTSPPRAATTVAWNVLLNAIFNSSTADGTGQIKRAYEVWMDMKKRGIKPSTRSFGTFLAGAAKVARRLESRGIAKGNAPKEAIGNDVRSKVETVFKQWTVYESTLRDRASTSNSVQEGQGETVDDLSVHPANQFIAFLSSAMSVSKDPSSATMLLSQIFSTFETLPEPSSSDPTARNAVTYALTLNAIRTALEIANSPTPPPSFPATHVLLESALTIFSPLLSSTRLPDSDPLTPQLATSFLSLFLIPPTSVLSLSIQSNVLELLPRLHGLVPPRELASLAPPVSSSVPEPISSPALDPGALKCVLGLLLKWDKLEAVEGVWQQVNDYPERYFASQANETEIEHAEIALEAIGRSGDFESAEALLSRLVLDKDPQSPLRARIKTFETLLDVTLRSGQYDVASRIYRLLAPPRGGNAPPTSASADSTPAVQASFPPSFKATTNLVLTAINTRDKTKVWSTVKFLTSGPQATLFGPEAFPPPLAAPSTRRSRNDSTAEDKSATPVDGTRTKKQAAIERMHDKREALWQLRYGQAISRALGRILRGREISLGGGGGGGGAADGRTNEEDVRKTLQEWQARVEAWVSRREKEFGAAGSGAVERGEMDKRRELVESKERERRNDRLERGTSIPASSPPPPKTLSQEEIERIAAGRDPRQNEEEEDEGERKVGRKERRMGWWKEREGDSMKEERAMYEARQRKFDEAAAKRSSSTRRSSFDRGARDRGGRYEREFGPRSGGSNETRRTSLERRPSSYDRPRHSDREARTARRDDRPKRQSTWESED